MAHPHHELMEEWRPVLGHEGSYEVSDQGRVRSLDRVVVDSRGRQLHYSGRMLTPRPQVKSGKLVVKIGHGNQRYVHQLVLEAFEGPCPPGQEGRHWDDDSANNRWPENLLWGTRSENMHDKVRNGRHHNANKTECKYGHLLSGDNLFIDKLGKRVCKQCGRDRSRRHKAKKAGI